MRQEAAPASNEVAEVAPGILRVQLPINFTGLGHTNMYVLEDGDGAAVIDTGLPGRTSWRALRAGLQSAGIPLGRVHTILITHSHPDHFGNAARLAAESEANIVTHRAFQIWWTPDSHVEDLVDADEATRHSSARSGQMPWHGSSFRPSVSSRIRGWWMREVAHRMFRTPIPTDRLEDGGRLRLGDRTLQAIHTPGHTADHLCWHEPDAGVLFSGDHVLPTITPHIAGIGAGPDPLADYVASLSRTAALPGIRVVLPAHGDPILNLQQRTESILQHHEERLDDLRGIVNGGRPLTVEELSRELFPRRRWGFMAESETFAHLEHLRFLGEVDRRESGSRIVFEAVRDK